MANMKIQAVSAAITTYIIHNLYGLSWFYGLAIFTVYFIAYQAYGIFIYRPRLSPLSRLPGPKVTPPTSLTQGHWLLGNLRKIIKDEPGQSHLEWMRAYRNPTGLVAYPGLFYMWRIMPTSASAVAHILNHWTLYVKTEQSRRALASILGEGLLVAEGDQHKRQRKVLNPAFATGYIREIVPIFWDKANDLTDTLVERIKTQTPEGIEVFRLLASSTLDIIGSAGALVLYCLTR
jgi:cytochrome P450